MISKFDVGRQVQKVTLEVKFDFLCQSLTFDNLILKSPLAKSEIGGKGKLQVPSEMKD